MEPLLIALVFGLFGGIALSLVLSRTRRGTPPTFVPRRLAAPSPALINMANIRVEGIGGLGLVAAVIAVAVADTRIRVAVLIAMILGGGLALLLIRRRRRDEDLHSGSEGPTSRSMPHIFDPVHQHSATNGARDLPHEAKDAGGRSPRIGVSRIVDLVPVRH